MFQRQKLAFWCVRSRFKFHFSNQAYLGGLGKSHSLGLVEGILMIGKDHGFFCSLPARANCINFGKVGDRCTLCVHVSLIRLNAI